MNDKIQLKIKELPQDPGVYIMRDADGTVIYVGKARNLKNRVRSYFNSSVKTEKTYALVEKIEDFDYIIAKSEVDALVLENTLIKKYKPHYNILLKDDKLYPFLRIGIKEDFPSVRIIRRLKADGAKYFGPYMIGITTNDMLDLLHSAFPLRWCDKELTFSKNTRPCLYHQLGKCLAPCCIESARVEYSKMIEKVIAFLQGDDKEIREILQSKMMSASENLDFESALEYKKRIETLDKMVRSQIVAIPRDLELDVFGFAFGDLSHSSAVMTVRAGKVIAVEKFALPLMDREDCVTDFIYQYYATHPMLCKEIVCSEEVGEALPEALSTFGKARLIVPKMGIRKQLTEMADVNAREYLTRSNEIVSRKEKMTLGATKQLASVIGVKTDLNRIECYDISHISGTDKVSSMVVFTAGEKDGEMYRRFKIKTVEGSNDFACMKETLARRLNRLIEGKDLSFSQKPDLMIIDGGIGQVEYACEAIRESGVVGINVIGLAKREETIVMPDGREINLSHDSFALRLIQRIRDEAHRFAITYHRKLRDKRTLESKLKEVKGIGDQTVKKLFARFKSFDNIAKADIDELEKVISHNVAVRLYEYFHNGE